MSLYNLVKKTNINAPLCLRALNVDIQKVGRIRDAWFTDNGEGVVILTRSGGPNRSGYIEGNNYMRSLDGFISDTDDEADCTYARFVYKTPEAIAADAKIVAEALVLVNKGEDNNGPGSLMKAFDPPEEHGITPDHPKMQAAGEAIERISKLLAPEDGAGGDAN